MQLINVRWYNACAHYAISLSRALKARGHRVVVAGDPESPPMAKARESGLEVYEDLFLSRVSPWMIAYNVKRMADLVEKERIDIVNAHRGEGHLTAALVGRFSKRGPQIVRTRGDVRTPRRNLLNRYLNDKLTDKIITTCEVLRESYIKGLQLDENRVANVPVGIDHHFFSPRQDCRALREKLKLREESLVVGLVGRLSPVKGHRYFIRSAEHELRHLPGTIFLVCGEDAQIRAEELKGVVRRMGVERNFRFLGKVTDVREIMALLDVGVVSSVGSETICRVALEYMSMGKPVVGTKVNAIPEVVRDGVNGFLVSPQSAEGLGKALVKLLRDEKKRRAFGQNSRKIVLDEFTLEVFARRTEEVYLSLLN